jgi:hypothetical protein
MVIKSDETVQITVRIEVHTIEREKDGSLKTYRYDSQVKFTGQNATCRFTMAKGDDSERARMFTIGKRQTRTITKQKSMIIKSVAFDVLDFIISGSLPNPALADFFRHGIRREQENYAYHRLEKTDGRCIRKLEGTDTDAVNHCAYNVRNLQDFGLSQSVRPVQFRT